MSQPTEDDLSDRTPVDIRSRLAAIVDSSNDAIISKDLDGVISTWNPAAHRLFGYSETEAAGQPITIIIPTDLHDEEQEILRRVRAGERVAHYETRRVTRDGQTLDVSITVSPVRNAAGSIVGASKILRDVTESKRDRAALREGEARFRLIANTAPVIIWMSDATKGWTYVNQAWLVLTGQSFDAALGNGWTDRIHPGDVVQCRDGYTRAFERREPFQLDFRLRRHDHELRWMVSTGTPRFHADGSFAGYIGSAIDVTEQRLAAEALATIDQRLIDAHEDERSRIAQELHDDISQRLAALTIRLSGLARNSAVPSADGKHRIEAARDEAMHLARDVRALSHRLHPARLEFLGIAEAAAALCHEMSSLRAREIRFEAVRVPDRLSRRITVVLYRVLQEALENAIKHSGVAHIEVSLAGDIERIELTVRDLGRGFDVATTLGRGLGLTSMKERVRAVRGRLAILSAPQRGTTIHASVPLV
jgi:PAS domain S-box-containing protein